MYEWKAIYNDGTFLRQFDDKESLFKDINQEKLVEFILYNVEEDNAISLFIKDGIFGLNGLILTDILSYKKCEYKLIYFVRRKRTLGNGINENINCLGFQCIIDGRNYKKIISINGNEIKFEEH